MLMKQTPSVIMKTKAPQGTEVFGALKSILLLAMGWTCVQAKETGLRMGVELVAQYAVRITQRIFARTRNVQGDGSNQWKKFLKEGQVLREQVLVAHDGCVLLLPVPPPDGGCEIIWNGQTE